MMPFRHAALAALLLWAIDARAVEFEKLGAALAKALGTKQVFKTSAAVDGEDVTVYYAKGDGGKPRKYAVVSKETYEPNCTHTWVVGLTSAAKVDDIRVVEMGCPHAFPARKASFLDQYKGKGPADVKSLKGDITTIAKATGSCELTTKAVSRSIVAAAKAKGSF